MSQSTQLNLPYLAAGQGQKHVTLNEGLRRLDALVQLSVVSASTSVEPGSPSDGYVYILPAGKTGAHWGAMTNHALAYWRDGAWEEIAPREGWLAFVKDADQLLFFTGAAWRGVQNALHAKGADIASASSIDLGAASGDLADITGTTGITALGTAPAGLERTVRFTGALTLTHNATSLVLPGAASIVTAAGDVARFRSLGSGNWLCVSFTRADGSLKLSCETANNGVRLRGFRPSTMSDDTAVSMALPANQNGFAFIPTNANEYALLLWETVSPASLAVIQKDANTDTATDALAGTTGTDGRFTASITDTHLYFENRRGGARIMAAVLFGGS